VQNQINQKQMQQYQTQSKLEKWKGNRALFATIQNRKHTITTTPNRLMLFGYAQYTTADCITRSFP
tara:strand:- start:379 stop:576 length:198 start_codon:yes stop_codon:yes gene_type:complete